MKKFIPLILFTIVLIPLVSCKSQTAERTSKTESTGSKVVVIEHLTPSTFKQKVFNYEAKEYAYLGEKPAIIDFYADWCGPCRVMAPTLQTIAEEYKDKITVYKVDVDEQKELAASFGITGIPSILFCPKGKKPQLSTGLLSKADFDKAIMEVLLK